MCVHAGTYMHTHVPEPSLDLQPREGCPVWLWGLSVMGPGLGLLVQQPEQARPSQTRVLVAVGHSSFGLKHFFEN